MILVVHYYHTMRLTCCAFFFNDSAGLLGFIIYVLFLMNKIKGAPYYTMTGQQQSCSHARIAHLVEHFAFNENVPGSIPGFSSKSALYLAQSKYLQFMGR